jgi:hypothetical protein
MRRGAAATVLLAHGAVVSYAVILLMSYVAVGGLFVHPRRHAAFALVKATGGVLILGVGEYSFLE